MMGWIMSSPDTTVTLHDSAFDKPVYVKSVFAAHKLQPTDFQINQVNRIQPDWVAAILIFCFVLLAWVQVYYPKRIQQIFRAPFSRRFINQLTRDGNLFSERIAIALGIVYFLIFALLLFEFNQQILRITFRGVAGISLYWLIIVILLAVITVKVALLQLLGIIFKTREATNSYLLNLLIFALLSGPVLLIAIIFIVYLKSVVILYITIAMVMLLFVFRFLRGFFIGMALRKFSYLFLFVYLCTLEILPLLVLIKFMLNQIQPLGE
jgi:hypothetical protein